MMLSTAGLAAALSAFVTVARVSGQSCVNVTAATVSSCPCAQATLLFTLEGETTIARNRVNLALILDGSDSIEPSDFELEKNFAKQAVEAFASRNLFDNGGMASYVQYSTDVVSSDTFNTAQAFNDFVDGDDQAEEATNTGSGIDEGRLILGTNTASASFMIVITDGRSLVGGSPVVAADQARDEGITVFAVGVGSNVDEIELLGIAGDESNLFRVDMFSALDDALASILSSGGGSVIPCPSTNAVVEVVFGVPVGSNQIPGGSVSGSTVTFSVADLEANATDFEVLLDLCGEVSGDSIVVSANYSDDQGNSPDLSFLVGLEVGTDLCAAPTPAPTTTPGKAPTYPPTEYPTPAPYAAPTHEPVDCPAACYSDDDRSQPTQNRCLGEDSAGGATYKGCYDNTYEYSPLDFKFRSERMTAQNCADKCGESKFFGTSNSKECYCGEFKPSKRKSEGDCDAPCAGDASVACGGTDRISLFKSDETSEYNKWQQGGRH